MGEPNDKDPKALECIDKIRAILTEYDMWGVVGVGSTTRFHWGYHFEPSWSCLHFNPATGAVRIRAKLADFKTKADRDYVIGNTVGAVFSTRDFAALLFSHMETVCKILDKQGLNIKHEPYKDMRFGKPK